VARYISFISCEANWLGSDKRDTAAVESEKRCGEYGVAGADEPAETG
jgi:hypothetical protein